MRRESVGHFQTCGRGLLVLRFLHHGSTLAEAVPSVKRSHSCGFPPVRMRACHHLRHRGRFLDRQGACRGRCRAFDGCRRGFSWKHRWHGGGAFNRRHVDGRKDVFGHGRDLICGRGRRHDPNNFSFAGFHYFRVRSFERVQCCQKSGCHRFFSTVDACFSVHAIIFFSSAAF